ncbi:uncharacterized protein AKAME5_002659400 [Lates japonicus]|uniref:Uncharacterized protein n=1 Tax=Lates japonicus TaxID=270547 RepID=A0AAD3NQD9_LATJO|nr:uncharacterized protein AKAME5_002659400 [Lates japonicus]
MDEEQAEKPAFLDESGRERDFPNTDAEMDPVKEPTPKDIQSYHPPLCPSQALGGLDYLPPNHLLSSLSREEQDTVLLKLERRLAWRFPAPHLLR